MKDTITFFVPGTPQALKRHRTFRRGSININIDPSASDKQTFLALAMQERPKEPIHHPLTVIMRFDFPRPKSHYNTKGTVKPMAPIMHTSRPDIDNLQKFVMDALNGVFWADDAVVCRIEAEKRYSATPGVSVAILEAGVEHFGFINGNSM